MKTAWFEPGKLVSMGHSPHLLFLDGKQRLLETCHSGPEVAVFHAKTTCGGLDPQRLVILVLKSLFCMHKTTGEGCKQYSLFILVLITMFCMNKTAAVSGTHRNSLFWSKSHSYASKNHRWGLGPIETSYSGANHAVLHAQNDLWGLEPIETCMLVQKSLFCMQKPQMRAGTHRD